MLILTQKGGIYTILEQFFNRARIKFQFICIEHEIVPSLEQMLEFPDQNVIFSGDFSWFQNLLDNMMRDGRLASLLQERNVGLIPKVQDFKKYGEVLFKLFGSVSVEHSILNFVYGNIVKVRPIEVVTSNGYSYSCFDLKMSKKNAGCFDLIISTADGARHRHKTEFNMMVEFGVCRESERPGFHLKFESGKEKKASLSIYQTILSYFGFWRQRVGDGGEVRGYEIEKFVGKQFHIDVVNCANLGEVELVLDELIKIPLKAEARSFEVKMLEFDLNFYGT